MTSGADVSISVSSGHTAGGIPPEILNSLEIFGWCKFLNVVPALLTDTAVFFSHGICKKNVAARCDFQTQNTPKCFAPDPTGGITELPDSLAGFQGAASRQGRGKGGGEGREGGKGRGIAFPHFFYNLTTAHTAVYTVAASYTRSLDLALQLVCSSAEMLSRPGSPRPRPHQDQTGPLAYSPLGHLGHAPPWPQRLKNRQPNKDSERIIKIK